MDLRKQFCIAALLLLTILFRACSMIEGRETNPFNRQDYDEEFLFWSNPLWQELAICIFGSRCEKACTFLINYWIQRELLLYNVDAPVRIWKKSWSACLVLL